MRQPSPGACTIRRRPVPTTTAPMARAMPVRTWISEIATYGFREVCMCAWAPGNGFSVESRQRHLSQTPVPNNSSNHSLIRAQPLILISWLVLAGRAGRPQALLLSSPNCTARLHVRLHLHADLLVSLGKRCSYVPQTVLPAFTFVFTFMLISWLVLASVVPTFPKLCCRPSRSSSPSC
jgi:hypothetical protein